MNMKEELFFLRKERRVVNSSIPRYKLFRNTLGGPRRKCWSSHSINNVYLSTAFLFYFFKILFA